MGRDLMIVILGIVVYVIIIMNVKVALKDSIYIKMNVLSNVLYTQ